MTQGIVKDIVTNKRAAFGRRPEVWLAGLLLWTWLSAGRSLGTPWGPAALTEALRWGAGLGLALAIGGLGRRASAAGPLLVTLTGALALFGILGSGASARSGLTGPYHDHQLYGSVLLLLLPFCAAAALSARQASWRWGALAVLAAGTLCLFLSQTRSAWAGCIAAALVFGWLWLSRAEQRPRRLHVVLIPGAALLLGMVFVWLLTGPAEQQAALTSRAATLTALSQDGSWQSRLDLWRGTARLIAAHPVLGIGLGRYPGEQWRWTHTGGLLAPAQRPSLSNEAHSFYLQTMAEMGLIGLGLYGAALAAFAAQGLRRLRTSRRRPFSEQETLLAATLSALAGQGMDALASPSWQFPEASFFFWAVLGLGLASLRREEKQTAPASIPYPIRRAGQWALSGSVAVVLAAQILPLGLLTPVEAYTSPKGWTLISVSLALVSPTGPVAAGSQLKFQVLAKYKDPTGVSITRDVTTDTDSVYRATATYPTETYLPAAFAGGQFTVPTLPYTSKSALTVIVFYTDPGISREMNSNTLLIPI